MIPYLSGGESPTADRWNEVFESFDAKLSKAMADHSILFFYRAQNAPDRHLAFLANLLSPRRFYFLDGANVTPTNPANPFDRLFDMSWAGILCGGDTEMVNYNHTPFLDAADQLPVFDSASIYEDGIGDSSGPPGVYLDSNRKIVWLKMPNPVRWLTIGRTQARTGFEKFFSKSLAVHKRTILDTEYSIFYGGMGPLMEFGTSTDALQNMEYPRLYEQAELIYDGNAYNTVNFPAVYDKFNFFRIHNLNGYAMEFNFEGSSGVVFTVNIPAYGSRCVRRLSVDTGYVEGWNHFHRFIEAHDPRFWPVYETDEAVLTNNVTNPAVIYRYTSQMVRSTSPTVNFPNGITHDPMMIVDTTRFWDAAPTYCSSTYPPAGADEWLKWINSTDGGYFPAILSDTLMGDLAYHRGIIEHVAFAAIDATVTFGLGEDFTFPYLLGHENISEVEVTCNGNPIVENLDYRLGRWEGTAGDPGSQAVAPGTFGSGVDVNSNAIEIFSGGSCLPGDTIEVTFRYTPPGNRQSLVFRGFDTLIQDFAAMGVSVTVGTFTENLADYGQTHQILGTSQQDLVTISTNLIYCDRQRPVRSMVAAIPIHNLSTTEGVRPVQANDRTVNDTFKAYSFSGGYPAAGAETTSTFTENYLSEASVSVTTPKTILVTDTVDALLTLNAIGSSSPVFTGSNQDTAYATFEDRDLRMTGFGPMLEFKRVLPLAERLTSPYIFSHDAEIEGDSEVRHYGIRIGEFGWPNWTWATGMAITRFDGITLGYSHKLLSPRVDMMYGKEKFTIDSSKGGVPLNAQLLCQAVPNRHYKPEYDFTEFKEPIEDKTVHNVPSVKRKRGLAFLHSDFNPYNIFTGLSGWYNQKPIVYYKPGGNVNIDTSMAWYATDRSRMQGNTIGAADGYDGTHNYFVLFDRLPLLIDHFNNIASLVNGIVRVRAIHFESMMLGPNTKGVNDLVVSPGVFQHGSLRPKGCWAGALDPSEKAFFESMGITVRTFADLPAGYQDLVDTPALRCSITANFINGALDVDNVYTGDIDGEPTINIVEQSNLYAVFSATVLRESGLPAYTTPRTTYDWVHVDDLKAACDNLGIPFIFQQVSHPVDLSISEVNLSMLCWFNIPYVNNSGFSPASGTLNSTTFEGRLPAIISTDDPGHEWVMNPVITDGLRVFTGRVPSDLATQYLSLGGIVGFGHYPVFAVIMDMDLDEDYRRRNFLPNVLGETVDPTLHAARFDNILPTGYRNGSICYQVPIPWLDFGTDYSLGSDDDAFARAYLSTTRIIPSAVQPATGPVESVNLDATSTIITANTKAMACLIYLDSMMDVSSL